MKRLVTLLLALALMAFAPMAVAEEPVVITVAVADQTNVEDWETNWTTLYVEEALNVDLQFHVYASTDYSSKLNAMIAVGDELEDVILDNYHFSDALVYSWAQSGILTALNDYFYDETLAPNLIEAIARTGVDYRSSLIMPDGNIYYVPVFNQSYGNEYRGKMWYYQDWLDQIDAEVPETLDELCDVLRTAVATDLNGNGVADEIGIAGYNGIDHAWFSYLMNSFVYFDYENNYMKIEDGVIGFSYTDERFREGVEYIAGMIEEGLIARESVTQNLDSWKTMLNATDYAVFMVPFTTPSRINDAEIKAKHIALAPMEGPNGVRLSQFNPSATQSGMLITTYCKNPEKAFAVGDLLSNELISIVNRWGKEGEDWDYVSNTEDPSQYFGNYEVFGAYIIVYDDASFWSSGAMQNKSWMQAGPFIKQYGLAGGRAGKVGNESAYDLHVAEGDTLYQTGGYAPEEYITKLVYTAEESNIISSISTDLNSYVKETVCSWLLDGATLTDASWEEFLNTVKELRADEWLECAQNAYDRTKG